MSEAGWSDVDTHWRHSQHAAEGVVHSAGAKATLDMRLKAT